MRHHDRDGHVTYLIQPVLYPQRCIEFRWAPGLDGLITFIRHNDASNWGTP
jgi:hypothetical protein